MLPGIFEIRKHHASFALIGKQIVIAIDKQHEGAVSKQLVSVIVTSVVITEITLSLYFNPVEIVGDAPVDELTFSSVEIRSDHSVIDIYDSRVVNVYTMDWKPIEFPK